ncbi:MAG: hypothetical protein QMB37_03565 [Paludibacteraceae bacterium]|nr:hypothetical protein [Paludibacteraceae bacterium]
MKKQNFLIMLSVIVALGLSSCGGSQQPKKANLKTQEDSLNYAMGLVISEEILTNGLQNDSSEINAAFLVNKIEKFYKDKTSDKVYKMGMKTGDIIKEQRIKGLYGNSTLTFNEELFKQGLLKGISADTTGLTGPHAIVYFQNTIQKIQNENRLKATSAPEVPADSIQN